MKEPSPTTDADNHSAVSTQPTSTLEEPAAITKAEDEAMLKKAKKRILPQELA